MSIAKHRALAAAVIFAFAPAAYAQDAPADPGGAEIAYGEMVSGMLAENGAVGERGNFVTRYAFSGDAGDEIEILMTSDDFDAYLELRSGGDALLAMDDDGAGNLNPLIRFTLPSAGIFYADATSYAGGISGAFSLTLSRLGGASAAQAAPQVPDDVPPEIPAAASPDETATDSLGRVLIAYGQTLEGALAPDDPLREDNTHYDDYIFQGRAGDRVRASMRSTDFDPYLYLLDGAGDAVAANDDGGGDGWNAMFALTLPADGIYILRANSLVTGDTGQYAVSIAVAEQVPAANADSSAPAPPVAAPPATPAITLDPALSEFFFGTRAE